MEVLLDGRKVHRDFYGYVIDELRLCKKCKILNKDEQ